MQESVYCKLLLNQSAIKPIVESVRKHKPPKGLIQALTVTEKQYAGIEFILGSAETDIVNTDERLIEI